MQKIKISVLCIILILFIPSFLTINVKSENVSIPHWNNKWSYRQEIILPIRTIESSSIFQPIDLQISFENPCWAINEEKNSIRVASWHRNQWYELESQIYDLKFSDPHHIEKCRIVFLVPEFANGNERYFVYYDNDETEKSNYVDHVSITDSYYFYEPIRGVSLEGDYYSIIQDGLGVYAVGQKGQLINRKLSQAILKMKPGTEEFDISNSDNLISLSFIYNIGPKDEDQVSSDHNLISKEIRIDGNLMLEFGIVSESSGGEIRTTNIYKYYFCPTEDKRIYAKVNHLVSKQGKVRGQINVDGTFGGIVTYKSESANIKRMRFGEIYPYLHIYGENNKIKEYKTTKNPETKEKEWLISYLDDCDLGRDAWLSFDEGETGKAFGVLFSSNNNIVKYGKDERDGIQVKYAEKEYLDVLGTEIDYAGIMFGRNSYEAGGNHDLLISDDLKIEFDVEIFTTPRGGYKSFIDEGNYFRSLIKHRKNDGDDLDDSDKNIYTLTVFPRLTGRILCSPYLVNISGISISRIWGELYQDGELVSTGQYIKPLLSLSRLKFIKLEAGNYVLKIFRQIGLLKPRIIGIKYITIDKDKTINVFCTWQKIININPFNQKGKIIKDVELLLFRENKLLLKNITSSEENTVMRVNYNLFEPFTLKAYYKGFNIYEKEIPNWLKNIDIELELYDLEIDVKDKLGFDPGVNVRPILTSSEMEIPIDLNPEPKDNGKYQFKDLLKSKYKLFISYAGFSDEIYVDIPKEGNTAYIGFSASFDINLNIFDVRGNNLKDKKLKMDILREENIVFDSVSPYNTYNLPPGKYNIKLYKEGDIVSSNTIELSNTKQINIVTSIDSILPSLITFIIIIFIIEISVVFLIKRISLNTFLKLLSIAFVILSLFQPWWALNARNEEIDAEKSSEMFLIPQEMIETIKYKDETHHELATLPEMFTDFVGILLFIIYTGLILLALSFIPNILLKRRFFIILITASIIFLTLVAGAFSFGMSMISEISLGSLTGQDIIEVILPNSDKISMDASWGLGTGFYLCIFSSLLLIVTGIIDYITNKKILYKFLKK